MLIGADYEAYCVSGYANREMCECDQTEQECPPLDTGERVMTPVKGTDQETILEMLEHKKENNNSNFIIMSQHVQLFCNFKPIK